MGLRAELSHQFRIQFPWRWKQPPVRREVGQFLRVSRSLDGSESGAGVL